jgi:hypothetical protein
MSTSNLNKIDARMQQKHDIAANWKNSDFVPEAGEYIIYDPDEYTSFPRMKIGDGIHTVNELFFVSEIYTDTEEPLDASEGAIWINPEENTGNVQNVTSFQTVHIKKIDDPNPDFSNVDLSEYKVGDLILLVANLGG